MRLSMAQSTLLYIMLFFLYHGISAHEYNFDVLLERTPYAQLLKELMLLTDTIVLLQQKKIDPAEKRFIEDSILGKLVRARQWLEQIDSATILEEDRAYACYWIDLAKKENVPPLLKEEIERFATTLYEQFDIIAV